MRVPIRKAGKYTERQFDPYLTPNKLNELKAKLQCLKQNLPPAMSEVKRLAEMGDFSENAAYSMAKARLRGLNQRILELESQLKQAQVIGGDKKTGKVQLGSRVTVEINGQRKVWKVLGSVETNPTKGIVSHKSPLGKALMEREVGEEVSYQSISGLVNCRIVRIE